MRWDRDPALLVRYLVRGSRGKHPLVIPDVLLAGGGTPRGFGHLDERTDRPDSQASLLESSDHQALSQLVAVLRRKDQTAFVVELRSVGAKKHGPPSSPHSLTAALHFAPPYPTFPHMPAPTFRFGVLDLF